jgi:alpha-beta hydrolase superfamily lysophospholipase
VPQANLGAEYREVSFTTSDGLELAGWYVPSRIGAAVIAFPGRNGPQAQTRMLARHGYGVLLFDRRGQGESEGDPHAFGWEGEKAAAQTDALAAVVSEARLPEYERRVVGFFDGALLRQGRRRADAERCCGRREHGGVITAHLQHRGSRACGAAGRVSSGVPG